MYWGYKMISIKNFEVFQRVGNTPFYRSSAIYDYWVSLEIDVYYQSWNEFTLYVSYSRDNVKNFATNNIILFDDIYYYVTSQQVDDIKTGLLVKGRSLFGHISDRMIMAENGNYYNMYPEQIARSLIDSEVVKPIDTKRTIYSLFNKDTTIFSTSKVTMQQGYAQLDTVIKNLMTTYGFGIKEIGGSYSTTDLTQNIVFYQGKDVSSWVDLSTDPSKGNAIIKPSFTDDIRDEKTFALIAGEGDYPNRVKNYIGSDLTDINRKELYVDARDVQKTVNKVTMSDTDYQAALLARGMSKLADTQRVLTLKGDFNANMEIYEFGKDFDVGDRVTISSSEFNMSKTSLIIAAKYTFDKDGTIEVGKPSHVDLTFDKDTTPKILFN